MEQNNWEICPYAQEMCLDSETCSEETCTCFCLCDEESRLNCVKDI